MKKKVPSGEIGEISQVATTEVTATETAVSAEVGTRVEDPEVEIPAAMVENSVAMEETIMIAMADIQVVGGATEGVRYGPIVTTPMTMKVMATTGKAGAATPTTEETTEVVRDMMAVIPVATASAQT